MVDSEMALEQSLQCALNSTLNSLLVGVQYVHICTFYLLSTTSCSGHRRSSYLHCVHTSHQRERCTLSWYMVWALWTTSWHGWQKCVGCTRGLSLSTSTPNTSFNWPVYWLQRCFTLADLGMTALQQTRHKFSKALLWSIYAIIALKFIVCGANGIHFHECILMLLFQLEKKDTSLPEWWPEYSKNFPFTRKWFFLSLHLRGFFVNESESK